jgi:hypothetical protein
MPTLINIVTTTVQATWNTLVTHPDITIPGTILLVGTMVIFGRKNRVRN